MATVVIRKPVTVILLIAMTVLIVAVTIGASGKSYTKVSPHPFEDIRVLKERTETRPVSTNVFAVIVMPIIGNIALFVPWAMLLFITLYSVERPKADVVVTATSRACLLCPDMTPTDS